MKLRNRVRLISSSPFYRRHFEQVYGDLLETTADARIAVLYDFPRGFALETLWRIRKPGNLYDVLVVTPYPSHVYHSLLEARRPAGVIDMSPALVASSVALLYAGGSLNRCGFELTPMQSSVTALLVMGFSREQIGNMLGIAYKTVNAHISAVIMKLGLRDSLDIVREVFYPEMRAARLEGRPVEGAPPILAKLERQIAGVDV